MRIDFRKSFARDLQKRKNDSTFLNRIKEVVEGIELAQTTSGVTNLKKLKGERDYYRIRLGSYRIGIRIENDLVVFIRALHRKDIYRYFP
ncbi:MAG: type II toxin-antitoxin system RelE/ParE family toxin [Thermodesulfobacteriota bacterium]|nr:type II toxin-antitoxin system RelE/ParE family toxin [Thermodesulfobacteriota bacterium]